MGLFQKGRSPQPELAESVSGTALPTPIQPLCSPAYEEVPLWNILPSYQLYQSTFSKDLEPSMEDLRFEPPQYEISPASSVPSDTYFLQTAPTTWENSILGNSHKLKRLDSFNHALAEQLKVEIKLTRSRGKRGVPPVFLDALNYEFLQGDAIHGYITMRNTSESPLSFDMFSVVFEGKITVNADEEAKRPLVCYKFLNMFDYQASWTPAFYDEPMEMADLLDPTDGARLMLLDKKQFEPNVTYKKFFSFTLPDKLLDCACEPHDIGCHCELLPSIGLEKSQFLMLLRKLREKPVRTERPSFTRGLLVGLIEMKSSRVPQSVRIKDFSFADTSVSYAVQARVVSKYTDYGGTLRDALKEEFIVVKDASSPLRVVPRDMGDATEETREERANAIFDNLVKDIKDTIELGRKLELSGTPIPRRASIAKHDQLQRNRGKAPKDFNEVIIPYKKKSLMEAPKVVGFLGLRTEKRQYTVGYSLPGSLLSYSQHLSKPRSFTVPLELSFQFPDKPLSKIIKPPEIKGVTAELVVCTFKTEKYPIPVELSQDMRFGTRSIEHSVIQPFQKYLSETSRLAEKFGSEALNLSPQMVVDMKCIANLNVKYNNFKIERVEVKSPGGLALWNEASTPGRFEKELQVRLDLEGLFSKADSRLSDQLAPDALCLIPSFQSCILGRYYYVNITIKLQNGDAITSKVGLRIEK